MRLTLSRGEMNLWCRSEGTKLGESGRNRISTGRLSKVQLDVRDLPSYESQFQKRNKRKKKSMG